MLIEDAATNVLQFGSGIGIAEQHAVDRVVER